MNHYSHSQVQNYITSVLTEDVALKTLNVYIMNDRISSLPSDGSILQMVVWIHDGKEGSKLLKIIWKYVKIGEMLL